MQENTYEMQVLAELDCILASKEFRARKTARAFLRYAVQETLAGRGAQLNQYTIAVHALGRSPDFSPAENPMVRIEAGRLRKLLDKYYQKYPATNTIMITMPKGSYRPEFAMRSSPLPTVASPKLTIGPRLLVHCYAITSVDGRVQAVYQRLCNELLGMLNRFHALRVILNAADAYPADAMGAPTQIQTCDYRFDCNIQFHQDSCELFQTVLDTHHNELVWANRFTLPLTPDPTQVKHIYRQMAASAFTLHSGKLLVHWSLAHSSLNTTLAAHQQVLVSYLHFLHDINPSTFRHALQTCTQRLDEFPHDSRALIIYAHLSSFANILQYFDIADLEVTWTKAARMAVALEPDNAEAHCVFAHNCFLRGDYTLCKTEFELALELNPFDISIDYLYAFDLYMMGEEAAGTQRLQQLMQLAFTKPDWYYLMPFICAFNQGDYVQALAFAERIQQFSFWGELARCVSYYQLGQRQACQTEFQKLSTYDVFTIHSQHTDKRGFFTYQAIQKILAILLEIKKTMV
ncbi:MAG: tetratricopeptide repeat protein [Thiothrix sp.]